MNKFFIPICAVLSMSFFSCEKNDDKIPASFNTIISLKEFGEKSLTLYNTGDDAPYEFLIFKGGKIPEATTQAELKIMDATDLALYSRSIGRSYEALPVSTYELKTKNLDFSSSDSYKKGEVVFKTSQINDLITANPDKNYVLPIQLIKIKDSVNAEQKLLLVRPKVVTPQVQYREAGSTINIASTETSKTYEFRLQLPFTSPWDFECTIAGATTNNVFEASQYDISNSGKVVFKKGTSVSEPVTVTILNSADYVGHRGVLPLTITNVSKTGVVPPSVPFNLNVVYNGNKIPLTTSMISANRTQSGDGGGIPALIDNDPATFYHSQYWPNYGTEVHYIQMRLNTAAKKMAFSYQNRNNANGKPQDIKISVSNNGTTWTELARVNSGLPTAAGSLYHSEAFESATPFTYVRFEVMRTNGGAAPIFFSFAEFSLYAK